MSLPLGRPALVRISAPGFPTGGLRGGTVILYFELLACTVIQGHRRYRFLKEELYPIGHKEIFFRLLGEEHYFFYYFLIFSLLATLLS